MVWRVCKQESVNIKLAGSSCAVLWLGFVKPLRSLNEMMYHDVPLPCVQCMHSLSEL